MKKIVFILLGLCLSGVVATAQQQDIAAAKPGVQYGKKIDKANAISIQELNTSLQEAEAYTGKVEGEVVQVCKKKGCFITLKREGDEAPIMVRFTDYGYFMPQDIVGKTVVIEGTAKVKELSVEQQRHAAEDLGKSQEEIDNITQAKRDIAFVADGVVVLK